MKKSLVDEARETYRFMLDEVGEDISIRREGEHDVTARARVIVVDRSKQIVGEVQQQLRLLIVSAEALSDLLPLTNNDEIIVRGKVCAIEGIDDSSRRVAGELIALVLTVAG